MCNSLFYVQSLPPCPTFHKNSVVLQFESASNIFPAFNPHPFCPTHMFCGIIGVLKWTLSQFSYMSVVSPLSHSRPTQYNITPLSSNSLSISFFLSSISSQQPLDTLSFKTNWPIVSGRQQGSRVISTCSSSQDIEQMRTNGDESENKMRTTVKSRPVFQNADESTKMEPEKKKKIEKETKGCRLSRNDVKRRAIVCVKWCIHMQVVASRFNIWPQLSPNHLRRGTRSAGNQTLLILSFYHSFS